MDYRSFVRKLTDILRYKMGPDYNIMVRETVHNNDVSRSALTILGKGENLAPVIELEDFYRRYQTGTDLTVLCRDIISCYECNRLPCRMDTKFLTDWKAVRDRIVCRLVGTAGNRVRLEEAVSRPFLDMSVIYYYIFETPKDWQAGIMIRKDMAKGWQVDLQELHRTALENTRRLNPPRFMTLDGIMAELLGEEQPKTPAPVYVLSSESRMHGAFWITDELVLEQILAQAGDHFLVLPSSVHECMILPESAGLDPAQAAAMVREINRTQLEPEEVLTDSAYRYQKETGLYIAAQHAEGTL